MPKKKHGKGSSVTLQQKADENFSSRLHGFERTFQDQGRSIQKISWPCTCRKGGALLRSCMCVCHCIQIYIYRYIYVYIYIEYFQKLSLYKMYIWIDALLTIHIFQIFIANSKRCNSRHSQGLSIPGSWHPLWGIDVRTNSRKSGQFGVQNIRLKNDG